MTLRPAGFDRIDILIPDSDGIPPVEVYYTLDDEACKKGFCSVGEYHEWRDRMAEEHGPRFRVVRVVDNQHILPED